MAEDKETIDIDMNISGADKTANDAEKAASSFIDFAGSVGAAASVVSSLESAVKSLNSSIGSIDSKITGLSKKFKTVGTETETATKKVEKLKKTQESIDTERAKVDISNQRARGYVDRANAAKTRAEVKAGKPEVDTQYERVNTQYKQRSMEAGKPEVDTRYRKALSELQELRLETFRNNPKLLETQYRRKQQILESNERNRDVLDKDIASRVKNREINTALKENQLESVRNRFKAGVGFGESLKYGLHGAEANLKNRRGFIGFASKTVGNLVKDRDAGDAFNGNKLGQGLNLGVLGTGGAILALSKLGSSIVNLGKDAMQSFGEIESIKTNLGVVYGSNAEAGETFSDLSTYAVKSPFGVKDVSEFAVLLKQSGVYSSDLLDTLKMIGDVSGGNQEKMKRIANNYAQIQAMGKANMLDLRQFANAGIPIYKELQDSLGVSQKTLRQMTSNGEITAAQIEKVFKKMTNEGGVFDNATEKGSKTYKAQIQNLGDTKQLSMSSIGDFIYSFGKDLPTANPLYTEGNSIFQSLLETVKNIYGAVDKIAKKRTYNMKEKAIAQYEETQKKIQTYINQAKDPEQVKMLTEFAKSIKAPYTKDEIRSNRNQNYILGTTNYHQMEDLFEKMKEELPAFEKIVERRNEVKKTYGDDYSQIPADLKLQLKVDEKVVEGLMFKYGKYIEFTTAESANDAIEAFTDALFNEREENKKAFAAKNLKAHRETMAMQAATTTAERYQKYSADEASSSTASNKLQELYKQTAAYKMEEIENQKRLLKEAKALANEQKTLGLDKDNKEWLKKTGSVDDANKIIERNFTASKIIEDPENITEKDIEKLSKNISDANKYILDKATKPKDRQIAGQAIFTLQEKMKTLPKEEIPEQVGIFLEQIDGIADKGFKKLIETILTSLEVNLVDTKKLDEVIKDQKDILQPFWKRYSSSVLGIPLEYIKKLDNGKSVFSIFKTMSKRQETGAIATAMLGSMSARRMGSFVKKNTKDNAQDVLSTHENFRNYAMSKDSSTETTAALLSSEQQKISTLEKLVAGGFSAVDTDVMGMSDKEMLNHENVDEIREWRSEYATAFDGFIEISEDGSMKFKENMLEAAATALDEAKANASVVDSMSKLKSAIDSIDLSIAKKESEKASNRLVFAGNRNQDFPTYLSIKDRAAKLEIANNVQSSLGYSIEHNDKLSEDEKRKFQDSKLYNTLTADVISGKYQDIKGEAAQTLIAETGIKEDDLQTIIDLIKQLLEKSGKDNLETEAVRKAGIVPEIIDRDIGPAIQAQELLGFSYRAKNGTYTEIDKETGEEVIKEKRNTRNQQDFMDRHEIKGGFDDYLKSYLGDELDENGNVGITGEKAMSVLQKYQQAKPDEFSKIDFSEGTLDSDVFGKVLTDLDNFQDKTGKAKDKMRQLGTSIKDTFKNQMINGVVTSFDKIGQNIAKGKSASDGLADAWKEIGASLLSSIGSHMITAGLDMVSGAVTGGTVDYGLLASGLALAAAGGCAAVAGGALKASGDTSGDDKAKQQEERLKNLRELLSQTIEQAKVDAEYYQKNMYHKQALSANAGVSERSVNDAIITPSGNIISTHPDDYLIATKTPETLIENKNTNNASYSPNITLSIINQSGDTVKVAKAEKKERENGDIDFMAIIVDVTKAAIADGEMDSVLEQREQRSKGISTAY